jgi:hypothetical protein
MRSAGAESSTLLIAIDQAGVRGRWRTAEPRVQGPADGQAAHPDRRSEVSSPEGVEAVGLRPPSGDHSNYAA